MKGVRMSDKAETYVFAAAGMIGSVLVDPAFAPALCGAALSVWQRWRTKKLQPFDFVASLIAGLCAGMFIGAPLFGVMGLTVIGAFMFALAGSNIVEAAIDSDGKRLVEWIWSLLRRGKGE